MAERKPKGANSGDFQLMFLGDVDAAPTIADRDTLAFDESSEKFKPRSVVYGSFYADDITQAVVIATSDVYVMVGGGMTAGPLLGVTFQNSRELSCPSGDYLINWSITATCASSDTSGEGGAMLDGAVCKNTVCETRFKESAVAYALSGTGIVSLSSTGTLSLCMENETNTADFTVTHASLTAVRL